MKNTDEIDNRHNLNHGSNAPSISELKEGITDVSHMALGALAIIGIAALPHYLYSRNNPNAKPEQAICAPLRPEQTAPIGNCACRPREP